MCGLLWFIIIIVGFVYYRLSRHIILFLFASYGYSFDKCRLFQVDMVGVIVLCL